MSKPSIKFKESVYAGAKDPNEFFIKERDEKNTPKLTLTVGTNIQATQYVKRVGYAWMYSFIPGKDRLKIAALLWAKKRIKKPTYGDKNGAEQRHHYYRMLEQETIKYYDLLQWANPYGTGFSKGLRKPILDAWMTQNDIQRDEWRRMWFIEDGYLIEGEIIGRKNFRTGKYYHDVDVVSEGWGNTYTESFQGLNPMHYQHLYEIYSYKHDREFLIHPLDIELGNYDK